MTGVGLTRNPSLRGPSLRGPSVPTYDVVAGRSAALVIRGYSTSFGMASRLLAQPVRSHVRNIYALVRIADEIVDSPDAETPGGWVHDALARLSEADQEVLRLTAWEELGVDDYLPAEASTSGGENTTEPIAEQTMGPLLIWATRAAWCSPSPCSPRKFVRAASPSRTSPR